jgi:hypothetical protein
MASAKDWPFRQRQIVPLLSASLLLLSSCMPLSLVDGQVSFSQDSTEGFTARVCYNPTVEALARDADFLERHIETYGSVVTKQPDVWGQSRLTIYRNEYEQLMKKELGNFQFSLQGTVSGSDQAYFADSFALGAAASAGAARPGTAGRGTTATAATSNTTVVPTTSTPSTDKSSGDSGDSTSPQLAVPTPASPTGTFDAFNNVSRTKVNMPTPIGFHNQAGGLTIEPTLYLDQKSVYLNHLHELRRISEGDDTADSPGYALNLVRFPVSILPGRRTYMGYGAEITMTMRPHLNEELLPTTFRNLVLNDVVEQVAFPATQFINNPDNAPYFVKTDDVSHLFNYLEKYTFDEMINQHLNGLKALRWKPSLQELFRRPEWQWLDPFLALAEEKKSSRSGNADSSDATRMATQREQLEKLQQLQQQVSALKYQLRGSSLVPATKSRRARLPFPPSQLLDIYGFDFSYHLVADPHDTFEKQPYSHPAPDSTQLVVHLPDVQAFFQEEAAAAYKFLQEPGSEILWQFCARERGLANAIRTHNTNQVGATRANFKRVLEAIQSQGATSRDPAFHHSLPAALVWGIIVESALLTDQLVEDMREATALKGCPPIMIPPDKNDFYKPDPSPEARQAFNQYVQCRWPTHAFALDPAAWEQNIGSTFSMRREMQLALSLAFVSGKISANNMMQFARRIEFDFATVDINGTAVGFSHGDETFGWRFYPRFQVPDVDNNLTVFFRDLLWGGPNKNVFLKERRLEPGIRECYAVIIMPSFVPYATLNVSANWFNLVNPQRKELNTQYAVKLSNRVKQIETCVPCIVDGQNYRDDEVERLKEKVNQLATRLPLQSTKVQIPYENTLGGFGMFNTGVTDLAPELIGWYGTSSINPNAPTTLFLAGDHFSVHQTTVVAGGQPIAAEQMHLLSRQVAQITIPPNPLLVGDATQKYVDVQLATPYGVTQHLLIPANVPPSPSVVWSSPTVQISPTGNVSVAGTSDTKSSDSSGTSKSSDASTPSTTSDDTASSKSPSGSKTPGSADTSGDTPSTSKSTGAGRTSDTSDTSNPSSASKSTGTSKSTGSSTATSTTSSTPSSTPATLLIKAGEINTNLYNVIDVTLQFDPKYGIQPITIAGVMYDTAQGGYAVPVSAFAPQVASALRQYVASNGTTVPPYVAATTQLAFRSTTHLLPPIAKTTANNFTIRWTK